MTDDRRQTADEKQNADYVTVLSERARAALTKLSGGVVVSCQARGDNPLHGPVFMAAAALAAVQGGAAGIRADGEADIRAIRAAIGPDAPIMGIFKVKSADGTVFITPTAISARAVIAAGAELVALDGTARPRPGGESLADVVSAIHDAGGAAMADIDAIESAHHAIAAGVDALGTTLSGYTAESRKQEEPEFNLLARLVSEFGIPVFAEGRIWTREQARQAIDLGAAFVVVGTAITNPQAITARFVSAVKLSSNVNGTGRNHRRGQGV